ncbi:MAG TPA: NAD(P)-dependent oxidoreductase [Edaphobacter sp.]|nr:NAD(P)-dependent oxidoreductase [Edaphobacter sp.]
MEKIGFIGVGVMGKPMAANLLRAGYSVSIVTRYPEKEASLIEQGALIAVSLQDLAHTSDVIILMLPDTNTVKQVLFGGGGITCGIQKGSIVIDMSTISPEETIEFAGQLAADGCSMLDAPVSGGEKGAEAGTLGIMVGGPREVFEKCRPIFEAMGKTITYTGPSGCGQKTKLVNQLVGAANLLGAVEGLRLARAAGLDEQTTLEAVSSGAASSWMLVNLGPKILQGDFAPGFSIRLQHKDVTLLKNWLIPISGDFPAANLIYSLFSEAMDAGLADQGNQGLINLWQNGKRLRTKARLAK